jgi:hypothetical protein
MSNMVRDGEEILGAICPNTHWFGLPNAELISIKNTHSDYENH